MTVSSQTSTATFVGNGVATAFPLPFRFFDNGDIRAYFIDSVTGAATQMVLGTDYTLIGAGEPEVDGNALSLLTTTVPLASMRGLYVERVMPQVQETDIVNQGQFFASTHEDVFDRLTMLIQQANGESKGAIRVAIGDPEPQRLIPAALRANLLLGFDSLGGPIAIAPASGSAIDLALILANFSDPSKGAAVIGRSAQVVSSIDELRLLLKTSASKSAFATGYYSAGDGGGGAYYYDATDTTTADNGGTVIVANDGGRWKLVLDGPVTIEQFGASPSQADNGPNIQAALNWASGAPVYSFIDGIIPVVTPITYDTTGDGEVEGAKLIGAGKKVTIFDNRTGGIMLSLTSGPSLTDFQNNIRLEAFGITNSLNQVANSGVQLTGLRFGRVAISVTDQGSHGLGLTSTVNDASDCINLDIVDGDYERNGGWGIFIDSDLNGVHANLDVSNNRCIENTLGGIWAATCTTSRFARNAIAYNGGDGLNLAKRAGGSYGRNNIVELNEFDSQDDQCVIQGQINTVCNNNYVIANSGVATPMVRGFVVTDSIGTRIDKTLTRVAPALTGITLFTVNAGSSYTSIIDTDYSSWVTPGNTKYANSSTTTEIIELESLTVSGAWTPIDSSGAGLVFTGASGRYVRNGNSITVTGQLTFPATANASNITIGGLPFQALTLAPGGLLTSDGAAGDQCAVLATTTTIAVYGATLTRKTNANYTGLTIIFSATYLTS